MIRASMKSVNLVASLLLCVAAACAADLPADMKLLCDRSQGSQFAPPPAPRLAKDAVLRTLSVSADANVIRGALSGEDVNALRGTTAMPALSFAASIGNLLAVRILLESGAKLDQQSSQGIVPIEYAVTGGQPGAACLLMKQGVALPPPNEKPYFVPAIALSDDFAGAATLTRYLLNQGFDVNAQMNGDAAIHIAAELGNTDLVKLLLQSGADKNLTNARGETAAVLATRSGHIEIAALLNAPPASHAQPRP